MAEVFRIEIPVHVQDQTNPGLDNATKKVTGFEKAARRTKKQLDEMNKTRWQLLLSAVDNTHRVINRVRSSLFGLVGRTWNISVGIIGAPLQMLNNIKNTLLSFPTLIAALGTGLAVQQGVLNPMKMADELTRAKIGFNTFLGAERGPEFMQDVRQFAVNTPFGERETREMAIQLLPTFKDDPSMIFRTLTAFGDASSLTGAGTEGMKLSLRGFRQIGAIGKLTMEELRQVTENLLVPLDPIIEELGIAKEDLSDLGGLGIDSAKAMDAILRALERPVSKGGFAGGMAAIMETLLQQTSILRDTLQIKFVERWGKGLESVAIPALKNMNAWFDQNEETVERWGKALEEAGRMLGTSVVNGIDWVGNKVRELTTSPEWKNATTLGEKMNVTWNFLKTGFDDWWSQNQGIVESSFRNAGGFLGGALKGGIMAALGLIDPSGSMDESTFVTAGHNAGKSFIDGFFAELDVGEIASRMGEVFKNLQPGFDKSPGENALGVGVDLLALNALMGVGGLLLAGPKRLWNMGKGIGSWFKGFKNAKWFGGKSPVPTVPTTPTPTPSPSTILGPDGRSISNYQYRPPNLKTPPTKPTGFWGRVRNFFSPTKSLADATVKTQSAQSIYRIPKGLENWLNTIRIPGWLKTGGRFLGAAGMGYSMYETQQWMNEHRLGGKDMQASLGRVGNTLMDPGSFQSFSLAAVMEGTKNAWTELFKGGISVEGVPIAKSEQKISIEVNASPQFSIQSAATSDEVLSVIRSNSREIGNVISEEIAIKMEESNNNMP
ncbi:tape measure protein [Paenibacillus alkalitolerans]|uniref:tape measure protein n=1 Tax=Paenibacillus alkalitolerans TaxID=2799335 RepID=UPI0018F40DAD|nr:tape measure protein [Paenibacillus alkalitolerans]